MIKRFVSQRVKLLSWFGLFIIVGAGLSTWQSFKSEPKHLNFSCFSKSFEAGGDLRSEVLLNIETMGQLVTFNYEFLDDGEVASRASLSGSFKELDVTNLDYRLQVDSAEIDTGDNDDWQLQDIADIINFAQETIELGESVLFDVRVVVMEIEKGYAVLQFCPGNSLWICEL
ncbi:hypothetical protein [Shewanella sp. Isolate11]|uniref:hypothetical protein n=1 Tax=Shewanella sp. Isolate11 TaxID=2908530 RepID=UPI001EFCB69B|nr:hypothetical protein [Shewanella sp. Isolate11]MCG9695727.1 hypothetical protein [Shewanella sp. Isolate11]